MLNRRKRTPQAVPMLPESPNSSNGNGKLRSIPQAETIQTLDPKVEDALLSIRLFQMAIAGCIGLLTISVIVLALRPNTPLVVGPDGAPSVSRQLRGDEISKAEYARIFLEQHLPILYTWSGIKRDENDPTGLKFIQDPGVDVFSYDPQSGDKTTEGKIPASVFNEQFILSEQIRESTLIGIAQLLKKTNGVIWQANALNPALGTSYRFAFRGRPSDPIEVSPGRWKMTVLGDIIMVSPSLGVVPIEKKVQVFAYDIYVVEAAKSQEPPTSEKNRDLVAHGRSSGFVIDLMHQYRPHDEVIESPK